MNLAQHSRLLQVRRSNRTHPHCRAVGQVLAGVICALISCTASSQSAFTCRTEGSGQICFSPPAVQYAVFGYKINAHGNSRDEACLRWAALTTRSDRRGYLGTVQTWNGLTYCSFELELPDGRLTVINDGDNRAIKVCPINSVMYDAAGRYVREHYYLPGALAMFPENGAFPLEYPVPPYPPSVMTIEHGGAYENAMCASRGAPDPTRNHGQPNGQTDSSSCNAIAGNPINIGVGVKSQTEVDYEGTRLRFTRSYNSGAGTNTFTALLGAGWQHSYARRLSVGSVTNPSYAEVVSAFRGDGRLVAYSASGPNWIKWPDVNDQLIEIRDTSGVRAGWKTLTATNDVETYDASGRLLSVVSSAGATTTLFYTDGTSSGDRGGVVESTSTPSAAQSAAAGYGHFWCITFVRIQR